jgi:hypothetical protein
MLTDSAPSILPVQNPAIEDFRRLEPTQFKPFGNACRKGVLFSGLRIPVCGPRSSLARGFSQDSVDTEYRILPCPARIGSGEMPFGRHSWTENSYNQQSVLRRLVIDRVALDNKTSVSVTHSANVDTKKGILGQLCQSLFQDFEVGIGLYFAELLVTVGVDIRKVFVGGFG